MFRQIMVPLDGSELAERALPLAKQLARACRARLHVVRVVDLLGYATWSPAPLYLPAGIYESDMQESTTYLDSLRARLAENGLEVVVAPLSGNVGAALLDYERGAQVDLVIMCSHGRSGLARFALGSVAERLLHYGASPLLLVRAFGPPISLAQVVVPLDGSARAEQALALVEALAGVAEQQVTLLRVIAAQEEGPEAEHYLAEAAGRLTQAGPHIQRRVEQGDPAERIVAAAGTNKLVVMATHGRMGVARWALGSVADRVARGGAPAVLLARALEPAPPSAT